VGGFALHAAKAGATAVVGVDSSASAIAAAQQNAQLNRLGNVSFEVANAFDFLRETAQQGARWDIIILDPPSFAKKRSSIDRAVAGYAELNRLALKALQPGGILVSASCTQLVPESMLLDILYREAARLKRRLRLLYRGTQAADHPVLLGMPETQYLKCLVFDVLD
jgi:23S rRNA (cytosine1962-C5)-methyltransferase